MNGLFPNEIDGQTYIGIVSCSTRLSLRGLTVKMVSRAACTPHVLVYFRFLVLGVKDRFVVTAYPITGRLNL